MKLKLSSAIYIISKIAFGCSIALGYGIAAIAFLLVSGISFTYLSAQTK